MSGLEPIMRVVLPLVVVRAQRLCYCRYVLLNRAVVLLTMALI